MLLLISAAASETTLTIQSETLSMLVDPVEKFMSEENDAAANDRNAEVPDDVCTPLPHQLLQPSNRSHTPYCRSRRASKPWVPTA